MIKFFRKMRQRLLGDNRMGKYLLYAIGEIILVVIGILIALAINNANETRKKRTLALTYIDQMISDLRADTLNYSTNIRVTNQKLDNCKYIMELFDQDQMPDDAETFILDLQYSGRIYTPTRSENTYQELLSTGTLNLLKEYKVLDEIRSYYTADNLGWYEIYRDRVVNQFLPILVDAIPFSIHEEIIDQEFEQDPGALDIGFVDQVTLEEVMAKLRSNPDFDFNLRNAARAHKVHTKIVYEHKVQAVLLLEALEELQNHNPQR